MSLLMVRLATTKATRIKAVPAMKPLKRRFASAIASGSYNAMFIWLFESQRIKEIQKTWLFLVSIKIALRAASVHSHDEA